MHLQFGLIKRLGSGLALGILLYSGPGVAAQPTPSRSVLALSKKDHTLAIVDPVSFKILARVPVGPDPHEVIASSDGKTAYVSNMGMGSGGFHEINVIDLVSQKALPNIDTGALTSIHGLAFVGDKLWFTAQGAKAIGRYDQKSAKIDWIMGTGQNRTHMIYVTADEKQVYTTNVASATVSILEYVLLPPEKLPMMPPGKQPPGANAHPPRGPQMDWVQDVIPVGKGSEGFDVSPDGKQLWTANAQDGTLSIIDIASKKVTDTVDAKVLGANRLKFTPDGKRVLISSLRTGDLLIYDTQSHEEVKRLNLGRGAAGILIDDDGARAFVGCTGDDYVAIVDLKDLKIAGHIDVGGGPDGLAWAVRH